LPRFNAIEGLRAWLAWAVVFWHLVQALGIPTFGGAMIWFQHAGESAVMVFLAISGFVITGLVVDKAEPWPRYILRRGFRIFPVYLVIFSFALFILPYGVTAATQVSWAAPDTYYWDEMLKDWVTTVDARPTEQLALHYALLQGVIPDSLWPLTSTAALGPAWSLSLEWQFYLVAPLFVWLVANDRFRMPTVIVAALLAVAYNFKVFGAYAMPSFLPQAAWVFLIGITCRLYFDRIRAMPLGPEIIPVALAVGILTPDLLWLGVWTSALVYLARAEAWRSRSGKRHWLGAAMDTMFASPMAVYLGARSYSVYLVHFPFILLNTWLLTTYADLAETPERIALVVSVLFATLVASDLLYRIVERPMIKLGARLAGVRAMKPVAAE
jgi:peptidoglycan/LPS O-acetylase OafA/YrhL